MDGIVAYWNKRLEPSDAIPMIRIFRAAGPPKSCDVSTDLAKRQLLVMKGPTGIVGKSLMKVRGSCPHRKGAFHVQDLHRYA